MKKVIMGTYFRVISTYDNQQPDNCTARVDSWSKWKKAESLEIESPKYPLYPVVQKINENFSLKSAEIKS